MTNDKNEIDEIAIPILKRILTEAQDNGLMRIVNIMPSSPPHPSTL